MSEIRYRLKYEFDRYYDRDERRSGAGVCIIDWKSGATAHAMTWGGYLTTLSGSPDNISILTGLLVCQEPGVIKPGDVVHMTYLARVSLDTPIPDSKARSYLVSSVRMGPDSIPQSINFEYSGSSSHGLIIVESYP